MEDRDTLSRCFSKKKTKKSNVTKSSHDDELGVSRWSGRKYKTTQFSAGEIKERAELFKREYNREDLHDRVLVLQVMPDDYEVRELTARMKLNECPTKAVKPEECRKSANKISASGFCTDTGLVDDKVLEQSIGFDRHDDQPYSSICRVETSFDIDSPSFCKPDDCKTSTRQFCNQSYTEAERYSNSDHSAKSCSDWDESITESGDIVCSSDERSNYVDTIETPPQATGESSYAEACQDEENDCKMTCDYSETINDSETYSVYVKPIPRERTFFPEVNYSFPGIERSNKADSVESGSMKLETAVVYSDETEIDVTECKSSTTPPEEIDSDLSNGSDDDSSARTCDVHVLREHRIYVHACWLAVNSHYFRSLLFESGMRECTSAEFRMKVSESEENAFILLLRSFYDPDVLDNLDITPLMNVLRLSVKYDARFSFLKAKRVLEAMTLTLDVCETILEAVHSGGLPDLSGVMRNVEHLLLCEFETLDETWESEKFASLSERALRFILGSDRLIVQSENTVFIALMQWIAKNAELYGDVTEYSDLLNLVRFEVMKPTYIHDVIREHEVATQLDNFEAVYLKAITYHALPSKRRATCAKDRQWCEPRTPTFMWIIYPEPEMFSFDEKISSTKSSSFWYFGYKMHLRLDLSTSQDETGLYLVVENLVSDGSVELTYDVEVKFGDNLHNTFTCDSFAYGRNGRPPAPRNYPFDEKYSVDEIKEIVLGGSVKVAITFEITLEKILSD